MPTKEITPQEEQVVLDLASKEAIEWERVEANGTVLSVFNIDNNPLSIYRNPRREKDSSIILMCSDVHVEKLKKIGIIFPKSSKIPKALDIV